MRQKELSESERVGVGRADQRISLADMTQHALLAHHNSVGVLINGRGDILYIHGRTGKFLEPTPGEAGMNILSMARRGLQRVLTAVLHRTIADKQPSSLKNLRVQTDGGNVRVNLTVRPAAPVGGADNVQDTYLVVLEELSTEPERAATITDQDSAGLAVDGRITALEYDITRRKAGDR